MTDLAMLIASACVCVQLCVCVSLCVCVLLNSFMPTLLRYVFPGEVDNQ